MSMAPLPSQTLPRPSSSVSSGTGHPGNCTAKSQGLYPQALRSTAAHWPLTHTSLVHSLWSSQVTPQAPQLGMLSSAVSQPLAGFPSQSPRPLRQWQVNDPMGAFSQNIVASSQLSVPVPHSSMSAHVKPLPVKPGLQAQVKPPPGRSVQVALTLQGVATHPGTTVMKTSSSSNPPFPSSTR